MEVTNTIPIQTTLVRCPVCEKNYLFHGGKRNAWLDLVATRLLADSVPAEGNEHEFVCIKCQSTFDPQVDSNGGSLAETVKSYAVEWRKVTADN